MSYSLRERKANKRSGRLFFFVILIIIIIFTTSPGHDIWLFFYNDARRTINYARILYTRVLSAIFIFLRTDRGVLLFSLLTRLYYYVLRKMYVHHAIVCRILSRACARVKEKKEERERR